MQDVAIMDFLSNTACCPTVTFTIIVIDAAHGRLSTISLFRIRLKQFKSTQLKDYNGSGRPILVLQGFLSAIISFMACLVGTSLAI